MSKELELLTDQVCAGYGYDPVNLLPILQEIQFSNKMHLVYLFHFTASFARYEATKFSHFFPGQPA